MAKTSKREFGDDAEEFVCGWLEKNKFKIVARNYVCRHGEIDIIALEKKNKDALFR
ncbi:MAG: YraN family protein [Planctomycetota bacterium]